MVLVCHESNDIFLEAAKVGGVGPGWWCCGEDGGPSALQAPGSLARLATPMRCPSAISTHLPILQMARYAKHETATTAIFVGELAAMGHVWQNDVAS